MIARRSHRADLEALAAEVSAPRRAAADPPPPPPPPEADGAGRVAEALELLDELKERLEDGFADTREFTANHPVAALSAAFLLGIAVGRLWRSA